MIVHSYRTIQKYFRIITISNDYKIYGLEELPVNIYTSHDDKFYVNPRRLQ